MITEGRDYFLLQGNPRSQKSEVSGYEIEWQGNCLVDSKQANETLNGERSNCIVGKYEEKMKGYFLPLNLNNPFI